MPTKIGAKKTTASGAAASAASASATTKAKKSTAAKKTAAVADSYAAAIVADPLGIGSIRAARGLKSVGELSASDGIQSEFPIAQLDDLKTVGRHATGFRLDGGSVRGMWVSARRIVEDKKKGFELFFWAHGAALGQFKERFDTLGAKKGTYQFTAADVSESDPDGKAALHRKSKTWSPSSSTALTLGVAGKWKAELNAGEPLALRGAMRIKVFGTPAAASKTLQEVVNKLGLQSVLAPSTPASIERLKMMRFIWQNAYDAAKPLMVKPFAEVTVDQIEAAIGDDGTATDLKAIDKVKLTDEKVAKRAKLASLLLAHDPQAFVDWAKNQYYGQHGIIPNDSYDYGDSGLESAIETAGVKKTSAAYKKAMGSAAPDKDEAHKAFLFGLLAKRDKASAEGLLARDISQVDVDELKAVAKTAGLDTKRAAQLRYEQVYPGYFTVVDPAQVDELYKAGARYLYSTYDDADRVMSMLTGGQKSSLTRFGEGLIIEGKSSSSDFGTGGAVAVFTRLVTKSAVEKGKKASSGSSYSWNYEGKFNNWGGSRPFKVILNKSILARTDWWGFNSDQFGKSTGLSDKTFGAALVKEIDKNYSNSNELMFPIGNDPAYADFVVCETEEQKKALVGKMKAAGMTEYNGKPVGEFVRVEDRFFEHDG